MSITLDDVTTNNLGVFKTINQALPVTYSDEWYASSFDSDHIVKLGFYSELPVGAIRGKLLTVDSLLGNFDNFSNSKLVLKSIPNIVYLETLAVLPSYQRLGIGTQLLNHLINETKLRFIHEIVVHVQTTNSTAIEWYERHGFTQKHTVVDYYKPQGLDHPNAYVYSLMI